MFRFRLVSFQLKTLRFVCFQNKQFILYVILIFLIQVHSDGLIAQNKFEIRGIYRYIQNY